MKNCFIVFFCCIGFGIMLISTGCGGGGGGTASGNPSSTATIAESAAAKEFIARQIAINYAELNTRSASGNMRANPKRLNEPRAAQTIETGVGTGRITYTNDVFSMFGVTYTYSSGYQNITLRDYLGNLTNNENIFDSIELDSQNMACSIADGSNVVNLVYNGKLILQGFYSKNSFTVKALNLTMAGNINNQDNIRWTMNGTVTVNQSSFPYPISGSSESGSIVFNGYTYNYSIAYNGTNQASVNLSGAENFTMLINLSTGAVVSSSQSEVTSYDILGKWKLVEEDRDGIMLPVYVNSTGKISQITFSANKTLYYENYSRTSNSNINYWITENVAPETIYGTYTIIGNQLTVTSGNNSLTHTITFSGNQLRQVNQWGEIYIWEKI
ncbi:MAG: hypothetical protein EOM80_14325 [Erysipelotrichia bacterium]|nr:hypothetical protein [Erysipelotrichia bacterium]